MPDGFFAKTEAEVALDLIKSYLEFADPKQRERYKQADAYFELFQKAFEIVKRSPDSAKKTGF